MRQITTPDTQSHSQPKTPEPITRQCGLSLKMRNCSRSTASGQLCRQYCQTQSCGVSWLLEETSLDRDLKELKSAIEREYFTMPERNVLRPQFNPVFVELAVVGGLVLRGSRIVVPRSLKDKVVRLACEGNQKVTKTKEYLRTRVWFPGLDQMMEANIQHCHPCQVVTPAYEHEPLPMSPLLSKPWKEVQINFSGPISMGEYLLVIKIIQTLTVGWCIICKQHQYPSSNTKAGLYVVTTWNIHGCWQWQWASIQRTRHPSLQRVPGL